MNKILIGMLMIGFTGYAIRHPCSFLKCYLTFLPYRKWIERCGRFSSLKGIYWFIVYPVMGGGILGIYDFFLEKYTGVSYPYLPRAEFLGICGFIYILIVSVAILNYLYPPPPCEEWEVRDLHIDSDRKIIFTVVAFVSMAIGIMGLIGFIILKRGLH